ncbi:MAG: hypothetical protein AAB605_00140 [Patescibacteria group bacterium]
MDARDTHKRMRAAYALLAEPTTTRQKIGSVITLLKGINPRFDEALVRAEEALSTLGKIEEGAVIELSAERLPENTEEEKKRKKALLLFIRTWKEVQSEVARVQAELGNQGDVQAPTQHISAWGRIFNFAKGPFGIVTAVVVVGVVAMQQTAVQVTIENHGCGTMYVSGSVPIALPGLKLPKEPIASGGSAEVELPGLTANVDGTNPEALSLRVLTFSMTFQLSSDIEDVTMDGVSLLGKKTEVHLSEQDTHVLKLICS